MKTLQLSLVPKFEIALIKQLMIHFHKQFNGIVDKTMNRFIPMCL